MRTLILWLMLVIPASAQITVRELSVVEASEKAEKIGPFVVVPEDFSAKPFKIAHAKWETKVPLSKWKIKLTDANRKSVPFIDLKEQGIVVTAVGHFWLEVNGTYFDKDAQDILELDEEADFIVKGVLPPKPDPDPKPDPTVGPPIPGLGLKVLIIYELDDLNTYNTTQVTQITSTVLQTWAAGLVGRDTAGSPMFRRLDKDTTCPLNTVSMWCTAIARPRTKLPWIIVSNDKTGFEGPLPMTEQETRTLIERYK